MWIEKNTKEKKKTNEKNSQNRSKNRLNNETTSRNSFLLQNISVNRMNQQNDQNDGFENRNRNEDTITRPAINDNQRITNSLFYTRRSSRHNGISRRVYAPDDILNDAKEKKEKYSWKDKRTESLLGTSLEIGFCRNNNEDGKDSYLNTFQSNITTNRKEMRTEPFPQFKKPQQQLSLTDSFHKESITARRKPYTLQNANRKSNLPSVNKNATSTSLHTWMDSKNQNQKKREMDLQDKGRNYQESYNLSESLHNEKMHSQTIGYTTNMNHNHSLHRNNNRTMSNFNKKELLHSELESNEAMTLTTGLESRKVRNESLPFSNLYYSQNLQTQEMLSSRSKRPNHSFNRSIIGSESGMNMEEKEDGYPKEKEELTKQRNALTLHQKIQKDIPRIIKSTVENHLNHSIEHHIENITEQKVVQYVNSNMNQIIQHNLQEFNTEEMKTQISEYINKEMEAHGNEMKEEKIKEAKHMIQEEIHKNMQVINTELKTRVHQEIHEEFTNKMQSVYSNVNTKVEEQLNAHVTNESVKLEYSLHKSMNEELKRKTDLIQNNIQNKLNTQVTRELIKNVDSLLGKINEHISKEVKKNMQCVGSTVEEYSEKQIDQKMQFIQMYLKDTIRDELRHAMNGMELNQIEQHQEMEKHIVCHMEDKCKEYMNALNIDINKNAQELQKFIQNEINHMLKKSENLVSMRIVHKVKSLEEQFGKLHENKNMPKELEAIVEKKQNQMFEYLDVMKTYLEETNENKFHFWVSEISKRFDDINGKIKEGIEQAIHKEVQMSEETILQNLRSSLIICSQKEINTLKNEKGNQSTQMQNVNGAFMYNINKQILEPLEDNTEAILNSKESLMKHTTNCEIEVAKSNDISNFKEEQKKNREMLTDSLDQAFKKISEQIEQQENRLAKMKQQMERDTKEAYDKIYVFLKGTQESLETKETKIQPIDKEEFKQLIKTEITNVMKEELTKQIKSNVPETILTIMTKMLMPKQEQMEDVVLISECNREQQETTQEELNRTSGVALSQVSKISDFVSNFINEYMVKQDKKLTKTLERVVKENTKHPNNTALLDRFEKIEDALKNEIIQTNMHMRTKEWDSTKVIQVLLNEFKINQEVMLQSVIHKLEALIKKTKKKRNYIVRGPEESYNNSLTNQILNEDSIEQERKRLHTVSNSENPLQANIEMKEGVHEKVKQPFIVRYRIDKKNRLVEISKCSKNKIKKSYV